MIEFSRMVKAMAEAVQPNPVGRITRAFQLRPTCSKCGQEKDNKEFSYDNTRGMLRSWCKVCVSNRAKEYYKTHKRKRKENKGKRAKEFDTRQSIAISSENWALVRAKAKAKGVSASELVRTYIEWGLENDE